MNRYFLLMMKALPLLAAALLPFVACTEKQENKPEAKQLPSQSNEFFPQGKFIDLTYPFSEETIYWVTSKAFELEEVAKGRTDQGFYYSANNFSSAEHGGTHIDAPIHFAEGKQSVDEIPLEQLMGMAIKINLSGQIKQAADYQISIADITTWEKEFGPIPENAILLLQTGFGKFYPDKQRYLGTEKRGPEAVKELHFPGLAPEAASWLVSERNIKAVGIDTPSIDYGQSTTFGSHVALMTHNIPAFENVAHLDQLPDKGFYLIALPMKIKGGSGGPLRIVAILP